MSRINNDLLVKVALIRCPGTIFTARKGGTPIHACMLSGQECIVRQGSTCKRLLEIVGDRSTEEIRAELLKSIPWDTMKKLKEAMLKQAMCPETETEEIESDLRNPTRPALKVLNKEALKVVDKAKSAKPTKWLSPGKAVHSYCVGCVGGNPLDVRSCGGKKCKNGACDSNGVCLFFKNRLGTGRPKFADIRKQCLACKGGSYKLVRECEDTTCGIQPYRFGKRPDAASEVGENHPENPSEGGDLAAQNRRSPTGKGKNTPAKKSRAKKPVSRKGKPKMASTDTRRRAMTA